MVKFSIVTICYENPEELKITLNSINTQTFKGAELIVIDGGSSKDVLSIIKEYQEIITYWVSEPDKGIYNAMNKGLKQCHGVYCQFLNSGDLYHDENSLSELINNLNFKTPKLTFSRAIISTNDGQSFEFPHRESVIDEKWLRYNRPNHQAVYFPNYFYEKNYYDESYKITGDSEYIWRAFRICNGFDFINHISVKFILGGISSKPLTLRQLMLQVKESTNARKTHENYSFSDNISISFKFISKNILSRIFGKKYHRIIVGINKFKRK